MLLKLYQNEIGQYLYKVRCPGKQDYPSVSKRWGNITKGYAESFFKQLTDISSTANSNNLLCATNWKCSEDSGRLFQLKSTSFLFLNVLQFGQYGIWALKRFAISGMHRCGLQ